MTKKIIKIKFTNGLSFEDGISDILNIVTDVYDFEDSSTPDFIIFGPYGNNIPPKGNYVRIGYFCECFIPDMKICEWGFGTMREATINNPHYFRIQWHGLNPENLIKSNSFNIEEIIAKRTRFCNFIYNNQVPYREYFFKQLNKYKRIDAPSKSMNNMVPFDNLFIGSFWERKRQFLENYKFTISFENYMFPGYQTEKLYDPMQSFSIPIYCGDPFINEIFNTKSFIYANGFFENRYSKPLELFENISQPDYKDMRFKDYDSLYFKVRRKLKKIGRLRKMCYYFNKKTVDQIIERIIEVDENDEIYYNMLKEPWLNNNMPLYIKSARKSWIEIFETR